MRGYDLYVCILQLQAQIKSSILFDSFLDKEASNLKLPSYLEEITIESGPMKVLYIPIGFSFIGREKMGR